MNILIIIIILLIIFFGVAGGIMRTPYWKGKAGEKSVAKVLETLPDDYFTLNDVVLETSNGTTQIDHIVISRFGVFTIETKNYRGDIYGDDSREKWTQNIVTKVRYKSKWWKVYTYVTKNQFYNPVKQSYGHAFRIKELLTGIYNIHVFPIVVFTGGANLNSVHSNHDVISIWTLKQTILKYQINYNLDVEAIRLKLLNADKRQVVSNSRHVRNLHAAEHKRNVSIKSGICPRCGGSLVYRKGRYGDFYGCSNYPNCTFTAKC